MTTIHVSEEQLPTHATHITDLAAYLIVYKGYEVRIRPSFGVVAPTSAGRCRRCLPILRLAESRAGE